MSNQRFQQFQQQQQFASMQQMQQQQYEKQLQDMSFKEQATGLIFVSTNCFDKCINNFDSMDLADTERECLKKCAPKMFATLNRVSKAFQDNQDKLGGK